MKQIYSKILLIMAMIMVGGSAWADEYEKVTSAPSDWSGEYLIVYEQVGTDKKPTGNGLSWNGLDAGENTVSYAITDDKITATDAVTVKVEKMAAGYSVKVNGSTNSGKYISSGTSAPTYSNGLKFVTTATRVDFEMKDGTVLMSQTISGNSDTSKNGTMYFLYNNATGSSNLRFRFYKDTNIGKYQQPTLYKKIGGVSEDVAVTGVSLNKTSASIVIGETAELTATLTPENATNKSLIWSSSDTKIASVSAAGVVKGISAGTATITVTTVDGSKTATCEVTVSAVAATGITLDKTSLEVMVGLSGKLTATIAPDNASNKKVAWSSSNEAIATVDANGFVTGVVEGTATITATAEDGGYTATCNVTVKKFEKQSKIDILFAPSSTTSDATTSWAKGDAVNKVFSRGYDYVSSITAADKVYPARNTLVNGVKFGSTSAAGTISFSLKEAMNVYKIIVSAAPYGDTEGFDGFKINGKTVSMTDGINKKYADYVVELDGSALSSITLTQNTAKSGRIYVEGITLVLEDNDDVVYSAKARKLTAQDSDKTYYATFSSTEPAFFPEATTVSTVNVEGGAMTVSPLATATATIDGAEVKGSYVPANTGVLISNAAKSASYYTVYGYTPAALTNNMLRPATAAMEGDYKFYKLAYDNITDKTNLGFYYGAEGGTAYTCKEGLAYLAVPASSAVKSYTFDQATSIKSVANTSSNVVYNLNGQRLNGLQKGINIVGGKKIFVK